MGAHIDKVFSNFQCFARSLSAPDPQLYIIYITYCYLSYTVSVALQSRKHVSVVKCGQGKHVSLMGNMHP